MIRSSVLLISTLFLGRYSVGLAQQISESSPPPACSWSISNSIAKTGTGMGTNAPWTGGVIPFEIDSTITPETRVLALEAFRAWEDGTPLRFIPHTNETDYLVVTDSGNRPSFSGVGMGGGRGHVYIGQPVDLRTMLHELGHTLGLDHEHQRSDRGKYVDIAGENLSFGDLRSNVENVIPTLNYTPYDFLSIMHYPRNALTRNGLDTIVPKEEYASFAQIMGTGDRLSQMDKQGITLLYSQIPVLISPEAGAGAIPASGTELTWNTLPSAVEYQVQISESGSFSALVLDEMVPAEVFTNRPVIRIQTLETGPLRMGAQYHWRVRVITNDGPKPWTEVNQFSVIAPVSTALHQNFPNPFDNRTTVEFDLTVAGDVTLSVFDLLGRKIVDLADGPRTVGRYTVDWGAGGVPSGTYLVQLRAPDAVDVKTLVVAR